MLNKAQKRQAYRKRYLVKRKEQKKMSLVKSPSLKDELKTAIGTITSSIKSGAQDGFIAAIGNNETIKEAVKTSAKETASKKVGNYIVTNWKILAIAFPLTVTFVLFTVKMFKKMKR